MRFGIDFEFPFLLRLAEFVGTIQQRLLRIFHPEVGFHELQRLLGRRHRQARRRIVRADAIQALFRHVVKERVHPVKFLRRQWIILVVVTFRATHRQAQPHGADRGHAIRDVFVEILVGVRAAFVVGHVVANKTGRDALRLRRLGQEIAGELFHRELVVRLVVVESLDDPIAPEPHEADAIEVITAGVGVAREIQPVLRHALAVVRRCQQPVHEFLVSTGRFVSEESIHFGDGRRQAGQIERGAADQRGFVRFRIRRELFLFEFGEREIINRVARPFPVLHRRQLRTFRRNERPMFFPLGAFLHPAF